MAKEALWLSVRFFGLTLGVFFSALLIVLYLGLERPEPERTRGSSSTPKQELQAPAAHASAAKLENVPVPIAPTGAESVALLEASQDFLPEEWEPVFFEIFEDVNEPMQIRNQRLMNLVLSSAVGVPSVQRAGLLHLAYGLPDDDAESFLRLIRSKSVPLDLRLQMLETVLNFRPEPLAQQLIEALSVHDELSISQAARMARDELISTSRP